MSTDFKATKAMFDLPEGLIYLDGNSLGPLPKTVAPRVAQTITAEWGQMLIRAWNEAKWMEMPLRVGDRIARLVGAEPGSVVMGDTLSIKVWQALASALEMVPGRGVILSDNGNFPSDLYIAQGLTGMLGADYSLRVVDPEAVFDAIDETVAVVMITETDYRTGRRHDMAALARKAHEKGALLVWDLAHSAGAFPVHLARDGADFAVGCTYKYLNSGPGGPAFIYVAPRHQERALPALSGWMGHAAPFAFDLDYRPATGVERMRVGTPPILALAALDAALDVWDNVDMEDLRRVSLDLQDAFIAGVSANCPDLALANPPEREARSSQVSFAHPEGYAIMQALIAHGVIGDFRAPDIMRFGFTPLYIDLDDVAQAVAILTRIMRDRIWDRPEYRVRAKVT
ncbi:kynureninase [Xinfangfangia sp. D13-10-4-6]|uniref:kynureninase n=1 Tax=Pseudogemmobacter hezensis TaxID=2737662 RepID=UPI0015552150|nr:kynureninase [Pseudogemmobacter hezensis]NPD15941.1 kynureninase [Pseudogemmobacter hezensis]